ncbi:MAG: hypothetical protein H7232_16080 [Aeromicrobium sp.]|nr:hypothetical protein [Burkholderiales bacterium]
MTNPIAPVAMTKTHAPISASVAKSYVDNWKKNGELLDSELAAYLRGMTDDENRRVIQRIFGYTHPAEQRPSGLLEQQRWFARLRK